MDPPTRAAPITHRRGLVRAPQPSPCVFETLNSARCAFLLNPIIHRHALATSSLRVKSVVFAFPPPTLNHIRKKMTSAMNPNTPHSIAAPVPAKMRTTRAPRTSEPVSQQPQAIQMNATKPSMSETSMHVERVQAQRLRGGGAGKDCLIGLFGCFICFECCKGCCECVADIVCCPCEMCC